ncbi:Zinc/iron permease [Multifurca ochricompacta]|uniref:Zinc/iron permease n=1 Tax=Multifurca ochricompacta TaxID=376703 RepID=A0AAD4M3F5_9AGAM|nr:Zinc/iron permease [Multifurca ochricompacta]
MALIFFVSLIGTSHSCSFPTISKRVHYLRIPPIVFFVGKHFGTGVILSTAFVHLLQDAFSRLSDPEVKQYTGIGRWTDISTAYVDNLHSYASEPSTPKAKRTSTPFCSSIITSYRSHQPFLPAAAQLSPTSSPPVSPTEQGAVPDEVTPLLDSRPSAPSTQPRRHTITGGHSHCLIIGHHRYEPARQHEQHHRDHPRCGYMRLYDSESREGDPATKSACTDNHQVIERPQSRRHNKVHSHGHSHHGHGDLETLFNSPDSDSDADLTSESAELVLQLGIMLHSLVIGFTLALASGADFESLVTAISFHQLFEGLSLGIRIAALPAHPDPQQSSLSWLRPLLALLFALTTPAGILSGLIAFGDGHKGGSGGVGAKVAEGVLSAISAGMLIYAACVEMLAADFVLDPTLWRASKGRQIVALASLGMGATGMVLLE